MKKTKIICTVGPSTDRPGVLEEMIQSGMNVARFNFSHGVHDDHAMRIQLVREAAKVKHRPVALMLDTRGPEMRLGKFADKKVILEAGRPFVLTTRNLSGTKDIAFVNHSNLPREVKPGDAILLSDGLVSLKVDLVSGDDIFTTVQNTGEIGDFKRVAAPGVHVDLPFLSEKDVQDILFGVKHEMDFIAASFVQNAANVLAIRKVLEDAGADMGIIAKIENAEGVKNIDEILNVSDGIMVARGDLGVEIPAEEVPLVQKTLIQKCNAAGKTVITATQMLESMLTNPRPTRAEASDIANAIFDGTDAIMLSGETASGSYPVEAVATMAKIAVRTEAALDYSEILLTKGLQMQSTTTEAISHATVQVALDLGAAAVITATESGYTARMVSKYRPKASIIAVTPYERVVRRMSLFWGVTPVQGNSHRNSDEMVSNAVASALSTGIIKDGDLVVITAGVPVGTSGTTNMIRVHTVGRVLAKGAGIGTKAVCGRVRVVTTLSHLEETFQAGDVLVIANVEEGTAAYAAKAGAIIAEEGGLTSHAAVIGISFGIPVIVGVKDATSILQEDIIVTVDAAHGLIYEGEINVK